MCAPPPLPRPAAASEATRRHYRHPPDLSDHKSTFAALLKSRLRLARSADLDALVDAYATDLSASTAAAHRPHRRPAEGVDAHKAQAAAVRARVGALQSAADILIGGPPAPPTPAVAAHILEQFITAPRSAKQDPQLTDAITAAWALAPLKRNVDLAFETLDTNSHAPRLPQALARAVGGTCTSPAYTHPLRVHPPHGLVVRSSCPPFLENT